MKASLNQSLSFYLSTYLTTVFIPSSWTHECAWLPRAFDCEGWRWLGERQPEKQTQPITLHQEHDTHKSGKDIRSMYSPS